MKSSNAKPITLKTQRLLLTPMTMEELAACILETTDEELSKAYKKMEAAAEADMDNRIWYVPWKICLRETDICVGDVGFKGPVKNYAVEIGYGLKKEYEGNGYMTEAVGALTEWTFMNSDILFIEAETAPENEASKKILETLKFKEDGIGEEGPRFVLEAAAPNYISIYMCLGMAIGSGIGISLGSLPIGIGLGICLGMLLGAGLDANWRKNKSAAVKARSEAKDSQK